MRADRDGHQPVLRIPRHRARPIGREIPVRVVRQRRAAPARRHLIRFRRGIRVVKSGDRRRVGAFVPDRLQPIVARVPKIAVGAGLAVGIRHPGQPAAVAHVRVAKAAEHIRDARDTPKGVIRGGLRDGVDRACGHAPQLVVRIRDRVVRQRAVDRRELPRAELSRRHRQVGVARRPRPVRHRRQPGVIRVVGRAHRCRRHRRVRIGLLLEAVVLEVVVRRHLRLTIGDLFQA